MKNIFLSRPTWVSPGFQKGLDGFYRLLESHKLIPRTIGTTDFPSKSPLDEVISLMKQCEGTIILGYPQIIVQSGTLKDKEIASSFQLGTEWNHIEAGLAYAQNQPLLIIHHHEIKRGIFDRGASNCYLHSLDLSDPAWALDASITGALINWSKSLSGISAAQSVSVNSTTPTCPNCSATTKKIYLSPIPPAFVELEGASHECTTCGYKLPVTA